jgi:hypothetical protein
MPVQSDNAPEIVTLEQWRGLNQQSRRASIDDQEEWWNENLFGVGPGNLRSCWGHGPVIYTAPSGTTILRIFFGYIGTGNAALGTPGPGQAFGAPPPGRLGWMWLSDGTIDQVDLDSQEITHVGGAGRKIWNAIAPQYWGSTKVWRPQWVGHTVGEEGGVLFGSPEAADQSSGGLYAWDGTTLYAPGSTAPDWLTDNVTGVDPPTTMPWGLPGIYTMEVFKERLWVAGKDVMSFSAPSNGADFSTANGGGSFGYFGDRLTYSFMDLCSAAGYLYVYGDSSTDLISNLQLTGQGTTSSPYITNFVYSNVDPQVGHRFPRPVGRWGRYMTLYNGAGIYLMYGGDAQVIGEKVTNVYNTLDTSLYLPTMAPATMFGFRVMLCNGRFTDPWGVTRNLLLMWHGSIQGQEFWSIASQDLELTNIGSYEQDSVITPYGTDGTNLYQLFAQPDPALKKHLSTKALKGQGPSQLAIKNIKRVFLELHDNDGGGVSLTGTVSTRGGGVPNGTQDISFEIPPGQIYGLEPQAVSCMGILGAIDLESVSPDFTLERLHIAIEERTLFGA